MAASKSKIEKNLQAVREIIASACDRAGRPEQEVRLVAVTKGRDLDAVKALLDLGVLDLGESRAQQLEQRAAEVQAHLNRRREPLAGVPRWHMIGHLQRNKVRSILDVVSLIHSVDSLRLAETINDRAERAGRTADVLLEVNCSQEAHKLGVAVGAAAHMAELIGTMKNLRLLGLMTMAPLVADPQQARPTFVRLRELFADMRREGIVGEDFRHLSMGMSQDYAVAVEEGATIVRIGTALFQ